MIRKLWLKFIAISMGALGIIFLVMLGAINLSMTLESERQIYEKMELIAAADGVSDSRQEQKGEQQYAGKAEETGKEGEKGGSDQGDAASAGKDVSGADTGSAGKDNADVADPNSPSAGQGNTSAGALDAASPAAQGQITGISPGSGAEDNGGKTADSGSTQAQKSGGPAQPHFIRYFSVLLDQDQQITQLIDSKKVAEDLDEAELDSLVATVLQKGKGRGQIGEHQYLVADKSYGKIIVFSDRTIENTMLSQLMRTCLAVGFLGIAVLLIVVTFLTKAILRPVQTAFIKQKQFISDASHELKTPLTVISTSADVLESEIGANKWLCYIRTHTERMNTLVHDLLGLARLDQPEKSVVFSRFDLSRAVMSAALPFESTAYESNKKFTMDIEENLFYHGDEERIKQLVSILTDNAFKYADDHGLIRLSLKSHGGKKLLRVYNTGAGLDPAEFRKIFERFYRSDDSRSRETGGYGLGLAIAKSIAEVHGGHICVESEPGQWICFTVTL